MSNYLLPHLLPFMDVALSISHIINRSRSSLNPLVWSWDQRWCDSEQNTEIWIKQSNILAHNNTPISSSLVPGETKVAAKPNQVNRYCSIGKFSLTTHGYYLLLEGVALNSQVNYKRNKGIFIGIIFQCDVHYIDVMCSVGSAYFLYLSCCAFNHNFQILIVDF